MSNITVATMSTVAALQQRVKDLEAQLDQRNTRIGELEHALNFRHDFGKEYVNCVVDVMSIIQDRKITSQQQCIRVVDRVTAMDDRIQAVHDKYWSKPKGQS